jgi:hypothetical protein
LEEYAARLWTMPLTQREGAQLADDLADGLRLRP